MRFEKHIKPLGLLIAYFIGNLLNAQDTSRVNLDYFKLDYNKPTEYLITSIETKGNKYIDKNIIILNSNLSFNQTIKIPGNEISQAIDNLWKQNYFSYVAISVKKIEGNKIFLIIEVEERPRLSKFSLRGIGKSEAKNLRDEISIKRGMIINEDMLNRVRREIRNHYFKKGYFGVKMDIKQEADTIPNQNFLRIFIDKGAKVKVHDIEFAGNDKITDAELRNSLSKTIRKRHKWKLWKSSKFIESEFAEDKKKLITKYNSKGFRDATITFDSVFVINPKRVAIKIGVNEGSKYYFRHITFTGNNKYSSSDLTKVLGIKNGDIYDVTVLDERLFFSQNGTDLSSLYMDDGYLFFGVTPIETKVENDSIDIEIRIIERTQATYNRIIIKGNTKTSDHVVLRELRTRPGQKFSRSDITRSIRELSQLGYFDPQAMGVNPIPNQADGTVDIEYTVAEKANDQIELSGGWGGNRNQNMQNLNPAFAQGGFGGFVGTLGLTLNNFSTRKLFKPSMWNPLPSGDGQRLSIRAQSNGLFYQSYNFSITEPWLGGKKPNSFTTSLYRTNQSFDSKKNSDPTKRFIRITGASLSLGKRLRWPDDFFSAFYSLSLQQYDLQNAGGAFGLQINTGKSNNLELKYILTRSSVNEPIFPTQGSTYTLSIAATPPISAFSNKNYSTLSDDQKYKWIEYHKWKFDVENYNKLFGKFVLATKIRFGYLGYYNKGLGYSPFERFMVGGSGLNSFGQIGTEIISLRGYPDRTITENAVGSSTNAGATIFNKFTCELRYSITNSPSASIYLQTFIEGGNAWVNTRNFNPFDIKRSAGAGVRLFLPMFGLLGLDYAYGFDWQTLNRGLTTKPGQFHFFIGQQF
ncbi:MAG: POTRA domain-containing protein [Bacteroidota bacterium]|nr:POTRA domain-containing protein [Bacteroidota bacterium]